MKTKNNVHHHLFISAGLLLCFVGALLVWPATPAYATLYFYVGEAGDSTTYSTGATAVTNCMASGGANCNLREAILALQHRVQNGTAQYGDATMSTDNHIIVLPSAAPSSATPPSTIALTASLGDLPDIKYPVSIYPQSTTSTITIDGNGNQIFTVSVLNPPCSSASSGCVVNISRFVLTDGDTTENGGALFAGTQYVTINMYDCTLTGTTSSAGRGTAVAIYNGVTLNMTRTTVANNTNTNASAEGTIWVEDDATLTLTNSTISGNTTAYGSAIFNRGAVTLTQSTISNNTGNAGSSSNDALNCYNESGRGAAVYTVRDVAASLALTNTLLAGNSNTGTVGNKCTIEPDCYISGNSYDNSSKTVIPSGVTFTSNCSLYNDTGNCGGGSAQVLDSSFSLAPLNMNAGGLTPTQQICNEATNRQAVDGVNSTRDSTCSCTMSGANCNCSLSVDQTNSATRPTGGYCDIGSLEISASSCTPATPPNPKFTTNAVNIGTETFPTFLFLASYDWLHNFTDRNARGTRGANQSDPDTDNFNKIIVVDSNLFPIMTSVEGDFEFPNITGRNSLTWSSSFTGTRRPSWPSVNDYFNRSIAAVPDFMSPAYVSYSILTSECTGGGTTSCNVLVNSASTFSIRERPILQNGGRSYMQWAFVTDPGNNNIRRYEFRKSSSVYELIKPDSPFTNAVQPPSGTTSTTVCNSDPDGWWKVIGVRDSVTQYPSGTLQDPQIFIPGLPSPNNGGTCGTTGNIPSGAGEECFTNQQVFFACKHGGSAPTNLTTASGLQTFLSGGGTYPYLEVMMTIPEAAGSSYTLPIKVRGIARDNSSDVLGVGLNTRCGDARPSSDTTGNTAGSEVPGCTSYPPDTDFQVSTNWNQTANGRYPIKNTFTFTITKAYDLSSAPGIQFRIRFYALKQGAFIMDQLQFGERDAAFSVNYAGAANARNTRWGVLTSFLETVPPKSFPGYREYTSSVGYGFRSNTSFTTANNVRFKDPRDIDTYRDVFDSYSTAGGRKGNAAPVYIFVADSGNNRIQVFVNATGTSGKSNSRRFPIRPVRVKGPNDSPRTEFKSNELGPRVYTGVNATAIRLGDGRPGDWRQYTTVLGTTLANSRIPAGAKPGDFFYPQGVAVDQDPDTKDVYLFVADTYNHRVQIFRDTTGVTNQSFNAKRFDFKFAEGWGSLPMPVLPTMTTFMPPGPYHFRYPKGIDVARFANNSSYLYVVDSKNNRLMKYLITEGSAAQGITNVQAVGGYGYNGTTFVKNLLSSAGQPLTGHGDFEGSGAAAIGFVNPQDVATGYNGFYLYSTKRLGSYASQVTYNGQARGVQFLDNHMIYVSDYDRNLTSISPTRLNMRIMQFVEYPQRNITGLFLPWQTDPNITIANDKVTRSTGKVGRSVFGPYNGFYNSSSEVTNGMMEGSTENVPGRPGYYTDKPVGMSVLTWNTVTPIDMRVMSGRNLYPNGATITRTTALNVAVTGRRFFGMPYTNSTSFTNFTSRADKRNLNGQYINKVHVFCYGSTGAFLNHTALHSQPFMFTPNTVSNSCAYMKVVAEDYYFMYSGRTGTQFFKVTN